MIDAPSCDENKRLDALYRYGILDTPQEAEYDELTALAADLFGAPIAVINFIDRDRQWFKSEVGLGVRETPLETSFCRHALLENDLLVVENTLEDPRFANNPLVKGNPHFRFYAGALLKSNDHQAIGTLCILDRKVRKFSAANQRTLRVLANQVMAQLEQKRLLKESETIRAELALANTRLSEQDRNKDQVLAAISHELRNPLSPILMTLEYLSCLGPHSKEVDSGIAVVRRQSEHLVRLVDDLLDVSRVNAGKISLQRKPSQLASVINRSIEIAQQAADQKKQSLHFSLPSEDLWLHADEIRLVQLFSNLLTNAVRYTPNGGEISLRVKRIHGSQVQVSVADNGMGIAEEDLTRVFESFVQLASRQVSSGGLGIGLHLCKHIVELHNGSLSVFSEGLNLGSEFIVTLPLLSDREFLEVNSATAVVQ